MESMLDRNPGTRITADEALSHPWFARMGLKSVPRAGIATGLACKPEGQDKEEEFQGDVLGTPVVGVR